MDTLVLTGALLMDGTGAEPVRSRAVVVEDGRITQIVEAGRAPRGRQIDLAGCTLLPGLINCHVHLCFGGEPDPVRGIRDEPHALTALKVLRRAQDTLEAGVTTVRDLGGRDYVELAVRRGIGEGVFPGPRILGAGKPVCMTGGHGHFVGREADGPDDVRKAVREQLKAGADVIKLIATGGGMTPRGEPGSPPLTLDAGRGAGGEVRAGRRPAAHAQGSSGIADAVEGGITTIEHGIFLTDEIIAAMKRKGTFLVPTLAAPAAISTGGLAAGIPEYMVRKSDSVVSSHVASFKRAHEAGVHIAAGADSGTPLNYHGSLLPELELMVKNGMTPLEAIHSATAVAAEAVGLGRAGGRVAPGYAADLLAVAGGPAANIGALAEVRMVLARGASIKAP